MSKTYLLVDFGASRIKSAILYNDEILSFIECPSITPEINSNNYFEISAIKLKEIFIDIVTTQYNYIQFDAILISSEMHGFILTDNNNHNFTNYISWKDERCLNENNIADYKKLNSKFAKNFLSKTGMELKACYPISKIKAVADNLNIKKFKVISLPEWFSCCSGESLNIANVTMSAGLGFYNINENSWDKDLISYFENYGLNFNNVTNNVIISGYFKYNQRNIPIYTGIGDFQAAILGAGYGQNIANLNLGTGSQVATISKFDVLTQLRPFFNGQKLSVITHIPSGRALNIFINFLNDINQNKNFWEKIDSLTLCEVLDSTLDIDLGVFQSAWNFQNFGKINNILEGNFNLNNFLSSLIKCYLKQFDIALKKLMPNSDIKKIIISGGIGSKVQVIKEYFEYMYPSSDIQVFKSDYDTTILGLKKLAEFIDRGSDV